METAIEIGYKSNLNKADRDFVYLIPEISFAHKLTTSGKLVLATKFKGHINFSNDIEFYQAAAIGGFDGLRGFRNQRFTGRQSYYQNTDIRYSFNKMKTSLLPIRIGIYGSFDYGRVWIDEESSNKWHNSYGGGFFINGAELMSVNLGAFYSEDGVRVAFMLGFGF
jgi:hemolysin activation/secretion protein